jgi:hypothetical protein
MPKRPRRDEILAWLKDHPDVTRYVIIDDEDDELDDLPLFQPSARTGLTEKIADGVTTYLSGKSDRDMRRSAIKRFFQNIHSLLKGHEG